MNYMDIQEVNGVDEIKAAEGDKNRQITTYHETTIDKHLFRITSVFLGKVELAKTLEDIAISKILKQEGMVLSGQGGEHH